MFGGGRARAAKAEEIVMVNYNQDYAPAVDQLKHVSFRAPSFTEKKKMAFTQNATEQTN
jgi:hypothetical protein